ncbi:TM0106 family RecB-like putative nuclease [Geodermatophilus sp. YIM 151500]|uniref:TM0106 family RecB-like putative nuclease n=1 Tax=Geodermatophilus sp. YIM 151500 TaxID=2984531 RepID=UPI0021E4FE25|nr:TM0106 family RecB-like putative nuclease [Geodermatophilus sp. YIM 151500]MCV2488239.1 TM0106 family RecB-like putative nuclease [Geodermatophilus sp. YIM 151500]
MYRVDGRLVLSPSDLTRHQECTHLTALNLQVADRVLDPPAEGVSDQTVLVADLGIAHELRYLESLEEQGLDVVRLQGRRSEAATLEAMRAGVDVVHQATLFDGTWGGQADFLLKTPAPSDLGDWSYEVADAKLARRVKVPALLQMATYADRLTTLQGRAPERICVVTGDGETRPWRLVDVAAYARRARTRLEAFIEHPAITEPVPVAACDRCTWQPRCDAELRQQDDLSLVAGMRRDHRAALRDAGVATLEQLAGATDDVLKTTGIGRATRERLRDQAREQLRGRREGRPTRTLLAPAPAQGLARLPAPSPGDLYLDFEGDPLSGDGQGLEYLAGLGDRAGRFTALWAHDAEQEKRMVEDLVDRLVAAWRADPGMHVYHYAAYEVSALKRLTGRYGVREAELDALLRAERFVDLLPVVCQSMRISKESYSIKKVEAFYGREHTGDVADAMSSVVEYEKWLIDRDPARLQAIEDYNRDDVDSTRELHDWLETQRAELAAEHGELARPIVSDVDAPVQRSDAELAELALVDRLADAGHPLLGDLVQWHRREARPGWWEFFARGELEDEQLVEDRTALGGLSCGAEVGTEKRSKLYAFDFSPQDTKLSVGSKAFDVDTKARVGEVREIDAVAGRVVVKSTKAPDAVRGLGPEGPLDDRPMRESIAATADDVLAGRPCLGQALLDRRVPAGTRRLPGEEAGDAVVRLGLTLDGEVLAVQGPPGSGKTRAASRLIRALLDAGKKVGVTATSHAVIGNVLSAVGRPALQKCDEHQACGAPGVEWSKDSGDVAARLLDGSASLVGGTAWFWCRPELAGAVDVLVDDEAGQFSLANAVAVARSARSLVLLGDPQQLAQPTQAVHPGESGLSALEHLLEGHPTVPEDRGVFLDRTWRMHPALTAFVSDLAYEGRLESAPGRERIAVDGWASGLAVKFVRHTRPSAAASAEEAAAVAGLWRSLQGVGWVDAAGERSVIGADDVLVVAPYNNQVGLIRRLLPDGARVGTVDKFQGQEAPVVVYSMTSSSADDAPRGIDFLYDLHRLNVAVSRAKALAVVVLSEELLDAAVRTPEQLRQVNALCRLVEMATFVG